MHELRLCRILCREKEEIDMVSVDAILVYSPEKELEVLANLARLEKGVDWKPAIILSAAYLEKFGIERLKRYFEKKKIKLTGKLQQLSLPQVATLLYGLELVEPKHFTQMNQIWKERIAIVHLKRTLPAYVGQEANNKYGKRIQDALAIIEYLKSGKKE